MFWDKLRPGQKEPSAVAVEVTDEGIIAVRWDDDKVSPIPSRQLRLDCPCASCIDEWTGAKLLDPSRIPDEIRPVAMEPVGNYAVQIRWTDGHETGLFTWRQLRSYVPGEIAWTNRGRKREPEAT